MLDLQKYADGNVLFDGQYKLLRRLSEAGGTADVWLALAVKTIDTLGDYSDEENSVPNEESGMKVAIKIYSNAILNYGTKMSFKDIIKIYKDKENKLYEITLSYNMILISFGIIPIPLTEKIINLNKPELRKLIISKTIKQAHQLNK